LEAIEQPSLERRARAGQSEIKMRSLKAEHGELPARMLSPSLDVFENFLEQSRVPAEDDSTARCAQWEAVGRDEEVFSEALDGVRHGVVAALTLAARYVG
jgi:hypothetical protein